MAKNAAPIDSQKAARRAELSANDTKSDTTNIANLTQQVNVQKMLNTAILAGRDAMQQAHQVADEAAIRKSYADRGDTNTTALDAEIARNRELSTLKQAESALTRAASMDAARIYHDEAAAIREAADAARSAGKPLSEMAVSQQNKAAWDSYRESVEKTALAVGSARDGVAVFFEEMQNKAGSSAQQVHDVLGGAFESLNSTLERLISGQKASFSDMFRGISLQLAAVSIKNIESGLAGSILGKMGVGKPQDPVVGALDKSNDYLSHILDAVSQRDTSGNGGGGRNDSSPGLVNGGLFGGILAPFTRMIPGLNLLSGGFGGHRALGGDVTAGMTYDVGEMGRERFTPTVNGKITPNKSLGGNIIHMPIDARGSNDPAQTEAAIRRAMQHYGPAIASQTIKAIDERGARRPMSAR